ncbi:hypothetical protein K227x_23210 [Rubripirellula lacrimiformis]|uniref:Uncharacterized protein n=1 Tax=Rubripirellula lacrimiformis TaxID=1930273 RepID=A0A517N9X5_9BACT|nr:hypothetical protein K227x_23210 [Rubripirellula lacrimiformis]
MIADLGETYAESIQLVAPETLPVYSKHDTDHKLSHQVRTVLGPDRSALPAILDLCAACNLWFL